MISNDKMKFEINVVTNFLLSFLKKQNEISFEQCVIFYKTLTKKLYRRYSDVWNVDNPLVYEYFRTLEISANNLDSSLVKTCQTANIPICIFTKYVPNMLIHVNPNNVYYQLHENNDKIILF
jgi:hypothetical protein